MILSSLPFSNKSRSHHIDSTGLSLMGVPVALQEACLGELRPGATATSASCYLSHQSTPNDAKRNDSRAAQPEGRRTSRSIAVLGNTLYGGTYSNLHEPRRRQAKNQICVHSPRKTYKWRSVGPKIPSLLTHVCPILTTICPRCVSLSLHPRSRRVHRITYISLLLLDRFSSPLDHPEPR